MKLVPFKSKKIRLLSLATLSFLILIFGGFWTFSIFYTKHAIEERIKSLKEQGHEIGYDTLKIHQFFPIITLKATHFFFDNILISDKATVSLKTESLLLSFCPFSPKKIKGAFHSLKGQLSKEDTTKPNYQLNYLSDILN